MTLACVWGTRPEAVKVGPVVRALRAAGATPCCIATGQHWDLLQGTPAESDLRDSVLLGLRAQDDLEAWVSAAVPVIAGVLRDRHASVVVVQGDTASVLAGALAAHGVGLPIVHVEAGVRSGTIREPYPEEAIRRWVTHLVEETQGLHLAPTTLAAGHLLKERVPADRIRVTGNPGVSALALYTGQEPVDTPENHVLITMHRREWLTRGPDHVRDTVAAVSEVAVHHPETRFTWPVHPAVTAWYPVRTLPLPENVVLTDPLPYEQAVRLVAHAVGVATDSGGLQEECCTLGVPCAVLRTVTDRPESLLWGTARLFSPSPDGMRRGLETLLARQMPRRPATVYGTADAATQCASAILSLVPATA